MAAKRRIEINKMLQQMRLSAAEKLRRARRVMEFTEYFSTERARKIRRELETR